MWRQLLHEGTEVARCTVERLMREDGLTGRGSPPASTAGSGGDLEAENRELRRRAKQLEQENEILRRATAYFARDILPK